MVVSMIDIILSLPTTPTEMIHVVRKKKVERFNGAESYDKVLVGDFVVSPQPLGTLNKVEGMTLATTLKGFKFNSVFGLYGANKGYKVGDLVTRSDGFVYEIQSIEPQGIGTPMEHVKLLVAKVDNQNG